MKNLMKTNILIFINMIQLKSLLNEQLGGRNAVFKQAPVDKTGVVSPFNAKTVAKMIYDSKGYFNDDETVVKNAIIKNIKHINQYALVNKELQNSTQSAQKMIDNKYLNKTYKPAFAVNIPIEPPP